MSTIRFGPHRAALRGAALRGAARWGVVVWAALSVLPACASRRSAPGRVTPVRPAPDQEVRDTSSVAIGGGKSIERLFAGRFAGVTVSAAAGGGLQIRIRGGSNSFMSGEEPLYVVDGTPLPQGTGGIVHLNPYDIEKIEILKDAPDTALYGVRGGNGVIRITTKRPGH